MQGAKSVHETLASDFEIRLLAATSSFLEKHMKKSGQYKVQEVLEVSETELITLGSVESNDAALAVVAMKPVQKPVCAPDQLTILLDDIRDPGNLGTIIRTADWYGIRNIIVSEETADCYNPKVINSSMGSFLRVQVYYTDLREFIKTSDLPVFGAFMDGADVHNMKWPKGALLVIGNEARGISGELSALIKNRVTIPRLGKAESLNASTALAIILDNYSRAL